jgi:hypothetical protein
MYGTNTTYIIADQWWALPIELQYSDITINSYWKKKKIIGTSNIGLPIDIGRTEIYIGIGL